MYLHTTHTRRENKQPRFRHRLGLIPCTNFDLRVSSFTCLGPPARECCVTCSPSIKLQTSRATSSKQSDVFDSCRLSSGLRCLRARERARQGISDITDKDALPASPTILGSRLQSLYAPRPPVAATHVNGAEAVALVAATKDPGALQVPSVMIR